MCVRGLVCSLSGLAWPGLFFFISHLIGFAVNGVGREGEGRSNEAQEGGLALGLLP